MIRIKSLVFVAALMAGGSLPAAASCSGLVTAINLQSGGAPVHVTVEDQNCNALVPASLTWSTSASVTIVSDSTGFNMSAPAGTAAAAISETATHTATGVHAVLTVNVAPPAVTALQFTSP
jgi:hypothetical protein